MDKVELRKKILEASRMVPPGLSSWSANDSQDFKVRVLAALAAANRVRISEQKLKEAWESIKLYYE